MKTRVLIACACLAGAGNCFAQANFTNFKQFYPVGPDADICYKSSYVPQETILFEANPFMRFSFHNNILKNLMNKRKDHADAYYVAFKPQFRMYTDNSLPVKMPNYQVELGTQQVFRMHQDNFLTIALETGHYSNGQSGSAFSDSFADGSRQGDSIYKTITPNTKLSDILNRRSGNFSTDITQLNFNYRINHYDDDDMPIRIHSFRLGFVLYHDRFLWLLPFGGYSDDDIKLYGRMRYQAGYEYTHVFHRRSTRITFSENIEVIQGAHQSVNPLRTETTCSYYPIAKFRDFGVFASLITGHDNYNYRFVDQATVFAAGIKWSAFAPFQVGRKYLPQPTENADDDKDSKVEE